MVEKDNLPLTKVTVLRDTEHDNPQTLLHLAIEKQLPMEQLERLMALKERYDSNVAKREFLKAMTLFQSICPALEKSKQVSFGTTKYKYAPLGEIAAAIKEPLKKAELSFRWEMDDATDKIVCTCIISHSSGHSERSTMSAAKDTSGGKNEIQSRGSTITYLQRYTLIAALGISTADEDNDAQTALEQPKQQAQPPQQQRQAPAQQPASPPAATNKKKVTPPPDPAMRPHLVKMDGKDFTKDFMTIVERLIAGTTTVEVVEKYYFLSPEIKAELVNIKPKR